MLWLERFLFHGLLIVFYWIIKFLISRKLNIQYAFLSMYTYMNTSISFICTVFAHKYQSVCRGYVDAHTTVFEV